MILYRFAFAFTLMAAAFAAVAAQSYAPPPVQMPDEPTVAAIAARTRQLEETLEALRRQGLRDPYLADAQIYHKAASWISRHGWDWMGSQCWTLR